MVTFRSAIPAVIILAQACALGCSPKSWWGERPRQKDSIKAPSSSGTACLPIRLILRGTEEESKTAFECVAKKAGEIWGQIEGSEPNSLNDEEIATLIRRRVIEVEGDPEAAVTRATTAKNLLGFKGRITKAQVDEWIEWARNNRAVARDLYRRYSRVSHSGAFDRPSTTERFTYTDFRAGASILASALQKLNLRMDSEQFAHAVVTVLDIDDRDIRQAATPAAEAAINALNLLCPTFTEKDVWNSKSISSCLTLATEHFRAGAAWFEFLVNPINDLSLGQTVAIQQSMTALSGQVRSWFSQPTLSPIYTARWMELARRLGARPPENMIESLAIVRNFGGESSKDAIHPEAVPYLYNIASEAQYLILKGMPYYLQALREGNCVNPKARYWTQCVLKDYSRFETPRESFALNLALMVKNLKHGVTSSPLDGRRFSRIMIMHAIAARIVDVFDPLDDPEKKGQRDHFISMSIDNENDPTAQVITGGITAADTLGRVIENVRRKLNHIPLPADNALDISRYDIKGLARLVAMTNEILVRRPPETRNIIEGLLANLTNLNPESKKLFLDQLSVTAILSMLTSLKDYRQSYLALDDIDAPSEGDDASGDEKASAMVPTARDFRRTMTLTGHRRMNRHKVEIFEDTNAKEFLVNRESFLQRLPEILQSEFPRTAAACLKYGFAQSCGVTFDEMLPAADNGPYIHAADLDLMTIIAVSMEGVIDSCDNDGDSRLTMGFLDGNDELDCGFARTKDVIQRLLESNIVKIAPEDAAKANGLLNVLNSFFLTRIPAKVAMARGTTESLLLNTLIFPVHNRAHLGTMYGLIADIMNPTRARAEAEKAKAAKNKDAPQDAVPPSQP